MDNFNIQKKQKSRPFGRLSNHQSVRSGLAHRMMRQHPAVKIAEHPFGTAFGQ